MIAAMKDDRRRCPHFGRCGGCDMLDLRYDDELDEKLLEVEHYLSRFGHVEDVIASPRTLGYRCKVQAVCGMDRGHLVTGIYRRGTHHLIPVRSCPLEDPLATEVVSAVRYLADRAGLKAWDEDLMTGDIRHILVRTSSYYKEALVVLVVADAHLSCASDLAAAIHQRCPYVKSVSLVENRDKTSMVIPAGATERVIYGRGYIVDRVCGLDFRISGLSFFQINPIQAERLYSIAVDMADLRSGDVVIDAYCGTGTIALIAASFASCRVIGIESNEDAVKMARETAKQNGIMNAEFISADASRKLKEMAREGQTCSVLFLDPPRSGSSEQFLAAAGRMKPDRIIYVSCNPQTLGRDLRYIHHQLGYRVKAIQPVDLFPGSAHIETVVMIDRPRPRI